ncbi:MAG: putative toxin-antitoxin system toxin component, PIN family [bacterium]
MIRAVLDTSVVVAAGRSKCPESPNREILKRWIDREYVLLISDDIAAEYAEKLKDRGVEREKIVSFMTNVFLLAEAVDIRFFHFRHYPVDEEDISFLLCAINGAASHLVSYDPHLLDLDLFYTEFSSVSPNEFLVELRRVKRVRSQVPGSPPEN